MEFNNDDPYKRAQRKVKELKGFYAHATVYIIVNIFLVLSQMGLFSGNFHVGLPVWGYFTTPFFWGIGLFFHGLMVFKDRIPVLRNWEEHKIKELMDREEKEYKNTFKDDYL